MRKLAPLLFLFVVSITTAQDVKMKTLEEVNQYSKKWAQLFLEGKIANMFDDMKKHWPIPHEKVDEMKNKTLQFSDMIAQTLGKTKDIVKVNEQNLNNAAYREVYYLRHEVSTLRAIFVYYNNGDHWILSSFEWDDKFSEEFKK